MVLDEMEQGERLQGVILDNRRLQQQRLQIFDHLLLMHFFGLVDDQRASEALEFRKQDTHY